MPLMVLTAPSILSVTSVSTSSGAAPGEPRDDDHRGKVDLRKLVDAELFVEDAAHNQDDRLSTVAKTGRLTQISASHCMSPASYVADRQRSADSGATM